MTMARPRSQFPATALLSTFLSRIAGIELTTTATTSTAVRCLRSTPFGPLIPLANCQHRSYASTTAAYIEPSIDFDPASSRSGHRPQLTRNTIEPLDGTQNQHKRRQSQLSSEGAHEELKRHEEAGLSAISTTPQRKWHRPGAIGSSSKGLRPESQPSSIDKATQVTKPTQAKRREEGSKSTKPKKREEWQVQKKALQEKFGDQGWKPRKRLSPDALDGIRALHQQQPDKYTTPILAEQFEVSPEAIRRILKSKWRPSEEQMAQRRERWAKRYDRIWDVKAELGVRPLRGRTERQPTSPEDADEVLPPQARRDLAIR